MTRYITTNNALVDTDCDKGPLLYLFLKQEPIFVNSLETRYDKRNY